MSSSSTYNIDVVNAGFSAYSLTGNDINGEVTDNNPQVEFNVGDTVNFNINASGHPFWIKTTKSTGTGNAVAGVLNNGRQNGDVTWTPDTPGTYYYICQHHSNMYGVIIVN